MLLHSLLKQFDPLLPLASTPDARISGVQDDSRRVSPGDLFIARAGSSADGATFVADAVRQGAAAVVVAKKIRGCSVPQIVLPDPAASLSRLANLFHGQPSLAMRALAITGTNGKTTTAYLLRHMLNKLTQRCGMIGTVEIDDGKQCWESSLTTPSATDIAALMASMRDKGCRACAVETSSHALDQGRVSGLHFSGAAFTNLTGDHLDYHKTLDNYAAAKAKLFESLDSAAVAVLNAEDKWSQRMAQNCKARIMRFGFGPKVDYRARSVVATDKGTQFTLHSPGGKTPINLMLTGRHNVENAMTAIALAAETFGIPVGKLGAAIADAQGAPGRLQAVRAGQPFGVLVDYAHTDDALDNVLRALRPLTQGKLRILFGCGGDRDRTKRPRMARTAEKLADAVYVTSDNPRTENPNDIIQQIIAGFSSDYRSQAIVEPDRRHAIERILSDAKPGDIVLLAGKGHENYQIIGTTKHDFDDAAEARRCLAQYTQAA